MGAEDEFDQVRKMINRMLRDAVHGKLGREPQPSPGGFAEGTRSSAEERRTTPQRFVVRVPADPGLPGPDVLAGDREVYVTMDLMGASIAAVRTRATDRFLFLEVDGSRPLQRVVELPYEVESNVRWTTRGGVLDLVLTRRRRLWRP